MDINIVKSLHGGGLKDCPFDRIFHIFTIWSLNILSVYFIATLKLFSDALSNYDRFAETILML